MMLNRVVLPAPLGPINPVMSPAAAVRFTSDSAFTPPNRIATPATSRTALGSRVVPATVASLVADADKVALLLEEHRGGAGRGRHPGVAQMLAWSPDPF